MTDAPPSTRRGFVFFLISVVASVALVVVGSVYSANRQYGAVFDTYKADEGRVLRQVAADKDAHATLLAATAQSSGFATSATSLVGALTSCLGPAPTAATSGEITQLVGFSHLTGAPRDKPPAHVATGNDSGESVDPSQMIDLLKDDSANTAQTQADAQANLIAQDEVNQDLDAVAAGVVAAPHGVVAMDKYAKPAARSAYTASVAALAAIVKKIAPSLKSSGPVKIAQSERGTLIAALTSFGAACEGEARSNAASTPNMVTMSFPGWGQKVWPTANFPYAVTVKVDTPGKPTPGCTSTNLLDEGTVSGALDSTVTIADPNVGVPVYKVLTHYTSATTVQYAIVECAS